MSMNGDIYSAVLHRLAEGDHGWGKPYAFPAWYILDHAVPGVENPEADLNEPAQGRSFDEALRQALRAQSAEVPTLIFVRSFHEVYGPQRKAPMQIRGGGAFVALGPIYADMHTAHVGIICNGGHRWVRWMRYRLERADTTWQIASREELVAS
jgi:hypothetical protein